MMLKFWFDNIARMQEYTMSDTEVQKLLESSEKFDLCIIEFLFNESLLGFGPHFGCKVIAVSTIGQMKYINDMVHNPMPLSTTPHPFLSLSDKMTFIQRMENVFMTTVENLGFWLYHYPLQEAIYDKYFTSEKPSFYTMLKHSVSLVLLNTHFSLNFPQAYLPNMVSIFLWQKINDDEFYPIFHISDKIEVGGFHVKNLTNPLPQGLKAFIETAKHGVIYFSLGNLNSNKSLAIFNHCCNFRWKFTTIKNEGRKETSDNFSFKQS